MDLPNFPFLISGRDYQAIILTTLLVLTVILIDCQIADIYLSQKKVLQKKPGQT